MRVAYVCADPGVPVFGRKGCSIHVQEIIRAFARRGDQVQLLAARTGGPRPPELRGVRLVEIPPPVAEDPGHREQNLVDANEQFAFHLRAAAPCDLIYERHSLWSAAAMKFANSLKIPGILEVNAPLIEEQSRYRTLIDRRRAVEMSREAFRHASALIAVSSGVADYLHQFEETAGRVHVISNGVDSQRFAMHADNGTPDGRFVVGFVGTLKAWHGVDLLVEAFHQLHLTRPQSRLVVIGDGPMRTDLQAQIDALPAAVRDAILLTGAVDPTEVPRRLAEWDVAVAPYPAIPGFYFSPLKLLEYMAAGRAVVASRIGQIEEIVTDGTNGVLCAPGSVAELTSALHMLHDNPDRRRQLGAAARRAIAKSYTWGGVLQRILQTVDLGPRSTGAKC